MRCIAVVGSSGAGKSTLAAALAQRLGLGHIELDALYHLENWSHPSDSDFRDAVAASMDRFEASHGGWTMCGDYESNLDGIRVQRCDTMVWLDLAKPLVISRVARRTVRRALRREELWNGNREPLTNFYSWDVEKNVIRWSWVHFDKKRSRYNKAITDGSWDHLTVHRLSSRSEINRFLADF